SPSPPTILDGILEVSSGQELLVALAAHLRAQAVDVFAGPRAELEHPVDVQPGMDQPGEIAGTHQVLLVLIQLELRHEAFLVALEGLAVRGVAERPAHPVQPQPAPREAQIENAGIGDRPRHAERIPYSANSPRKIRFTSAERRSSAEGTESTAAPA